MQITEDYNQKIKQIISKTLNINNINVDDESLLIDLGADSLDGIELIMELEKEFDMSISDDLAEKFLEGRPTVGDLIKFFESICITDIRKMKINKLIN